MTKIKQSRIRMGMLARLSAAIAAGSFAIAQESPQVAPAPAPDTPVAESSTEAQPEAPKPTPPQIVAGDEAFLREAAQIHATGVELAKLAEKNAGTEEVQAFSQELLAEHTRSLAAVREIGRSKSVEVEEGPTASQQAIISEFAGKIGRKFDDEYRAQALKNHEDAIRLFAGATKSAKDADVRMFAERSLGEMKEKHAAMGGDALDFKGEMALKLPKSAKPAAKPAKGTKAKPDPASAAIAATAAAAGTSQTPVATAAPATSAPPPPPSATNPTLIGASSSAPSTTVAAAPAAPESVIAPAATTQVSTPGRIRSQSVATSMTYAPASVPPASNIERRLPAVAEGPVARPAPTVANDVRASVPDARARWTVPAEAANEPVVKRPRARQKPVAADLPDDPEIAAAPVAKVVTRTAVKPARRPQVVVNEAPVPEGRVIIRQVPARRAIRIFDGGDDDDDDDDDD